MAKYFNISSFSGLVGDVVGCNGPFGFYIRKRPRKAVKEPTLRQREWRAKMALVVQFLVPLREIIYRGMAGSYGVRSKVAAMNRAFSLTVQQAVEGSFPDLHINPAKVQLSRGPLLPLSDLAISIQDEGLKVEWKPALQPFNAHYDDVVYVIAYNVKEKTVAIGLAERMHGSLSIDLSAEPSGSELAVYACVSSREGKSFSTSQYLGEFLTNDE